MPAWRENALLRPVALKLDRAATHASEFIRERNAFMEREPYQVVVEPDVDAKTAVLKFIVGEPAPDHLGAIAGDFLHNIRSGFNVLAWLLAGHESGKQTEFPIYLNQDDFFRKKRNGDWHPKSGMAKLQGFDPKAIDTVIEMQPFRNDDPERQGLWLIHKAAIADRHHNTTIMAGVPKRLEVRIEAETKVTLREEVDLNIALDVGEHVMAVYDVEVVPGRRAPMHFVGTINFEVAFDIGGPAGGALAPEILDNGLTELDVALRELGQHVR